MARIPRFSEQTEPGTLVRAPDSVEGTEYSISDEAHLTLLRFVRREGSGTLESPSSPSLAFRGALWIAPFGVNRRPSLKDSLPAPRPLADSRSRCTAHPRIRSQALYGSHQTS